MSADPNSTASDRARGAVTIATRPLWRLRLTRALPRYLLYVTCAAGLLSSARFMLAPPRADAPVVSAPPPPRDLAAEGYAALFARRYLSWDASQPELSERQLTPMLGSGMEPNAGLTLPSVGEQHVIWAQVVQARRLGAGAHVYTVAAQTDTAGLVYLTVGVLRRGDGKLALLGYPAFVGAPATGLGETPAPSAEVGDRTLVAVVERALRNYLAASPEELAADLSSYARVAVPDVRLTLESTQRVSWSSDRRSVLAIVQAHDARGAGYTLAYEVDVREIGARWEVSAIEMDPDA